MEDGWAGDAVNKDTCGGGCRGDRNPLLPTCARTKVSEGFKEERPQHQVKSMGDVELEKHPGCLEVTNFTLEHDKSSTIARQFYWFLHDSLKTFAVSDYFERTKMFVHSSFIHSSLPGDRIIRLEGPSHMMLRVYCAPTENH